MTPVVFLHGIGGGARSFAPQIASFAAAGYQPVTLDMMGYGAREPVERSEERRVGKECRSRWSPYH